MLVGLPWYPQSVHAPLPDLAPLFGGGGSPRGYTGAARYWVMLYEAGAPWLRKYY